MQTAKRPLPPGRRPRTAAHVRWRAVAIGAVVAALAAAGCSSSGGGGSSSSGGKTTITELDYFTASGGYTTKGYVPGAISECTYHGTQYCYAIGTNTVGIFYNKAMFAAAHLSPPTTWAELQSDA